jgi:hypothetical protein
MEFVRLLYFLPPLKYHRGMARGWESKSVADQQSLADPTAAGAVADVSKRNGLEQAKRVRQKQELDLQRERILSERTSSPVRRAALEAALAEIESRLALLSWACTGCALSHAVLAYCPILIFHARFLGLVELLGNVIRQW